MKILVLIMILLLSCAVIGVVFAGHLEKIGCGFLSAGNTKDHCYQDAAVRLSMPSVCFMVSGAEWGNVIGNPPQAKCLRRIAVKEKDPFICYKIVEGHPNAETQSECFAEVAYATGNSAYCDFINQNISRGFGMFVLTKESCYQKVGSLPRYCEGINDLKELNKCFVKMATESKNLGTCEKIISKEDQKMCLLDSISELYSAQELRTNSCDNLNDVNLKYICILMTASLLEENQICNKILEANWKQVCTLMTELSKKEFDEKYTKKDLEQYTSKCNSFSGKGKSACLILLGSELDSVAIDLEDKELQTNITKDAIEIMLQGCLNQENDDSFTPMCIVMIGKSLKPEYCTSYSDSKIKDGCYYLAAIDTGDCTKIKESSTRSDCKANSVPAYKIQKDKCKNYPDKEECSVMFKYWIALKMNDITIPEDLVKVFGN
jgi:hypothetical protein